MKKLLDHPTFIFGLVVRLSLILWMSPLAVTEEYVQFLDISTSLPIIDPWLAWIEREGKSFEFSHEIVISLLFIPLIFAANLIGVPSLYAYNLTLLAADFCLLLVLNRLIPDRQGYLLIAYWLSPIIIFASYVLGLNALIPVLLLMLSIFFIKKVKLGLTGFFVASAISTNLSMVVAFPFFLIYLFHNQALRTRSSMFIVSFSSSLLVLNIPLIFSGVDFRNLLSNLELSHINQLSLGFSGTLSIYIVPLIYLMTLYFAWRIRRLNFDLFQATTGIAFLLMALLTPASPSWFVWCIPFLALYQAMRGRIVILMVGVFSTTYVLITLLVTPLYFANGSELALVDALHIFKGQGVSLLHTGMLAIGLLIAIRAWHETISGNEFFRISRRPFVLGVAGDSGAGKDTFSDAIAGLFGEHSVAKLSGDDYHLWDRQKPIWQVMTHLNPMANDLERFCDDLVSLSDGKSVFPRHYNHKTGKLSKPSRLDSNDFVIASGLHAFYLPVLRESYDLKVYLDIDEGLRQHFKLRRDVHQRGHSVERVLGSFAKREPDSERFIRPQSKYADLIFSLQPIHPRMLEELNENQTIRMKLVVSTQNGFNQLSLHRVLVGVCGLHVDVVVSDDGTDVRMTIEGDTSSADISIAAKMVCGRVLEFLDVTPKWQNGLLGLMQLIALSHIDQALTKRLI
jgi:uridine kinase